MSILDHPSIAGRISTLEADIAEKDLVIEKLKNDYLLLQERCRDLGTSNGRYEEKVKNCLLYVANELDGDVETIKNIAEQIAIDLTEHKSYEMNVTINVEIEVPFGEDAPETGDLEYDLDVTVDSSSYCIVDYSVDNVYTTEA